MFHVINVTESSYAHVRLKAPVPRFVFRKFSISSYFVILVMCKMVTLSVGKNVCPCVLCGVIRRDTGNIHVIGVFIRLWGHYLLRNTQVIQVPLLWPSVLRDVVFRYQMLAQLLSSRYLPACHLPQVFRGCGHEEQALRSPRSVVVSGSAASHGRCARTKVLVMSELSDS